MSVESTIYDFENVIPKAVADALFVAGLSALYPLSDAKYQQQRPRVDVTFKLGSASSPLRIAPSTIPDGYPTCFGRNSAWTGELSFHAITDVTLPGKLTHADYRAKVRNACATLLLRVNDGVILPFHSLNALVETGTTHGIRTNDGYEQSSITYHIDFSLNNNAWLALAGLPVVLPGTITMIQFIYGSAVPSGAPPSGVQWTINEDTDQLWYWSSARSNWFQLL